MKREKGGVYTIIDEGQEETSGLDLLRQDLREQHGEDYVVTLKVEIVKIYEEPTEQEREAAGRPPWEEQ